LKGIREKSVQALNAVKGEVEMERLKIAIEHLDDILSPERI